MSSKTPYAAGTVRSTLLLAALSCATAAPAAQVSYQYFRFTPTKLGNDATANSVALSEFELLSGGAAVSTAGAWVTSPYASTPAAEVPNNLIDLSTATKWLDYNKTFFVIEFPAAVQVDGYRFSTSNDAPERDPVRWTLEGSADGVNWTLLDNVTTDYPTPATRLTSTPDIPLPATADPAFRDWKGTTSATWDTTTANWSNGSAVLWDNGRRDIARFGTGAPTTVTLAEAITARGVNFATPGYLIQGGGITFTATAPFSGTASGEIASPVAGTLGLIKTSPSTVTLSGSNTFTGILSSREGTLRLTGANAYAGATTIIAGGTIFFDGAATKTAAAGLTVGDTPGKGTLMVGGTSNVVFNGSPLVGTGTNGAGVIRQSGGTATYAASGTYLTLGNSATAYGAYELSGGSLITVAAGGLRVGWLGSASYSQTGGDLNCGRWFAIGGAAAKGVATFSGGTASVASGYRYLIGDQAGGEAVMNIGTQAGGNAVVTALRNATGANDGGVVVSANGTANGTLNLNSGVLNLNGRVYQAGGTGRVNLNGGTLRAAATGVELMNNSIAAVKMFRGGLTVDTNGVDASLNAGIAEATGSGVYVTGGSIPVTAGAGGAGYIAAPYVSVTTSGAGTGVTAVATVSGGAITGVVLTSPGEGYLAGDTLTFSFTGGGSDSPADPFEYKVTAAQVLANNTGGLTKSGAGKLSLGTSMTYPGPTTVSTGTLEANAFLSQSPVTVAAGATLAGNMDSGGLITVNGTLSPGVGVGLMTGSNQLKFNPGSTYLAQIKDWTGDAGTGYDTANFASLVITATTSSKMTIQVDGTGITNFTESARQFTLATGSLSALGLTTTNWQVTPVNFPGTGTWAVTLSGKSLVLSYTPGATTGYSTWTAGYPTLSDKTQAGDPDGDGISNVMEYVLNGNPGASSRAILPQGAISGSNFQFTFVRRAESKSDTTQAFEYGSTLTSWTSIAIPAATNASVTVTADQPSTGLETVVVSVPVSAAVNGRLFGRLSVTTTP